MAQEASFGFRVWGLESSKQGFLSLDVMQRAASKRHQRQALNQNPNCQTLKPRALSRNSKNPLMKEHSVNSDRNPNKI